MMAALPIGIRRLLVQVCVATVMCATAPFVRAEAVTSPTAEILYQRGLEEYKAQRYETASALLAQSFEKDPQPQALFAWAQSERLLFHCEKALLLFDRFIALSPTEQQTAAAQLAKRRCVAPPAAPPAVQVPSIPAPATPQPLWYKDVLGGSLCAVGVAAIVTGVGLIVSAQSLSGQAQSADTLGESQSLRLQAERRWNWGAGTSVLGAVLFSGGIGRYVWVSHANQGTLLKTGGTF